MSTIRLALAIICLALVLTVAILPGSFHTSARSSSVNAGKHLIPINPAPAVVELGTGKKSLAIAGNLLEFITKPIAETNSPPVAVDDAYTVHGTTQLPSVLANDYDPDGDGIQFASYGSQPQNGYLVGSSGFPPSSYTPNFGYTGTDTFTYSICDNLGACSGFATVTLNVGNSAPVAV